MSKTLAFQNGDFLVLPNGQLLSIDETDKAEQDLDMALTTRYDSERDLGSKLYDMVEDPGALPPGLEQAAIADEVSQVVDRLRAAQERDDFLDEHEALGDITSLRVTTNAQGGIYFHLEAETLSGEVVGNSSYEVQSLRSPEVDAALPNFAPELLAEDDIF